MAASPQRSWNGGINFYGFPVAASDKNFIYVCDVIRSAAEKLESITQNKEFAYSDFDAADDLNFVAHLHTFGSNVLGQLKTASIPHAIDLTDIADCGVLVGRCGFGGLTPHLKAAESARTAIAILMSHRWEGTRVRLARLPCTSSARSRNVRRRNGTKLAFSLNLQQALQEPARAATNLGPESPQIAGELIYALVECLGDVEFHVPSYEPSDGQQGWQKYTCTLAGLIPKPIGQEPQVSWTYDDANHSPQDVHGVAGT